MQNKHKFTFNHFKSGFVQEQLSLALRSYAGLQEQRYKVVTMREAQSITSSIHRLLSSHDIYSCFDKGCPTKKHKSVRDNTERHDGLWLFTVASSISRDGRRCYEYLFACVKRNKMDSEFLTCLLIYLVFPRLPFGIVAYTFMLFFCRNSCI